MQQIEEFATHIVEEIEVAMAHSVRTSAEDFIQAIIDAKRIVVAGSGRTGLMAQAFAMRLMQLGFSVNVACDATTPGVTSDDLVLVASGSGITETMIIRSKRAKAAGARLGVITTNLDSPVARLADVILPIPAPSPKFHQDAVITSIQPMGSLFEQCLLLTLDAVVLSLMERQKISVETMMQRHTNLD